MANSYQGPATLIVDGESNDVYVEATVLASGGMKEWRGWFSSEEAGVGWKAFNAKTVRLRLGDQEAVIVPVGGNSFDGENAFQGSGRPPF